MSGGTEPGTNATATPEAAGTEGADAPPTVPCANCGHPRNTRFCPACGQNDRDYIRSLPPLLGDILKETFETDSRIRHTLPKMFLRPGELPCEFSRNRRARYMSPVRLYLVTSIVFFFLLSSVNDLQLRPGRLDRETVEEQGTTVQIEVAKAREADTSALKAILPPPQRRKVDEIIAHPGMVLSKSIVVGFAADVAAHGENYDTRWRQRALARGVDVIHDPRAAWAQFIGNLPLAMFVTLPAYTLLLMVFFFGSRRFFSEHLVFTVQLHTFAFVVLAGSMLLHVFEVEPDLPNDAIEQANGPPPLALDANAETSAAEQLRERRSRLAPVDDSWDVLDVVDLALFLWLLAYHYLALRRFYDNGRLRTAVKWALLTSAYMVLLLPGILFSAAFTIFQMR